MNNIFIVTSNKAIDSIQAAILNNTSAIKYAHFDLESKTFQITIHDTAPIRDYILLKDLISNHGEVKFTDNFSFTVNPNNVR